jgi:hypothetical protein
MWAKAMADNRQKKVGLIDSGVGATHLEVAVDERNGEAVVLLQLCTWSEELGQQVQKTISFSASKLGQLQRLLSQARSSIEDSQSDIGALAQIIPLVAREPVNQPMSLHTQPARHAEAAVGGQG